MQQLPQEVGGQLWLRAHERDDPLVEQRRHRCTLAAPQGERPTPRGTIGASTMPWSGLQNLSKNWVESWGLRGSREDSPRSRKLRDSKCLATKDERHRHVVKCRF